MCKIQKINETELAVKEYQDFRVVTFKDIDTVHGRPEGTAKRNFNTNKKYFIDGEDYFTVCADEIRTNKIMDISDKAHQDIVFFTESGYLMLVKSFTDDLAWSVQRQLVKSYFRKKQPHNVKVLTITSRDICKIIGRVPQYHGVILREIRDCIKELEEMGFNRTEFFIDSTYLGGGGGKEIQPQFLVTDRGCEYFSGRLEPEERRVFLIECTDRFERLQNVLDGKPFKPVRKAIEQGETVLELYRNNKWGILAMDGDLYNLTPEELEMVYNLVPKLNKGGVTQIPAVISAMLEGSERGGKLERIGGYHCTGGSASSSAENAPKNQKAGNSRGEEPVDLDKVIVLTKEQAKARYNISLGNLRKVADDIGAIRHMGNRICYSRKHLDEYFQDRAE